MFAQKIIVLVSILGLTACTNTKKDQPYIDYAHDQLIAQLQDSYPQLKVNTAFVGKKAKASEDHPWQMICGNLDAKTTLGPWLKQKRFYMFIDGADLTQLSAEPPVIDDPQSDAFHEDEWQEYCQK